MSKITKISFLLLILGLFWSGQAIAQESLAYVNPDPILFKWEIRKTADQQVETYRKTLEKDFNAKVEAFKNKEEELYAEIEKGLLSPQQIQDRKTVLQTNYDGILKYEQDALGKVEKKRIDLYTPIYDQLKTAIEKVAREQGFNMILDGSIGAVLHAEEITNLTPAVAKELGIPIE